VNSEPMDVGAAIDAAVAFRSQTFEPHRDLIEFFHVDRSPTLNDMRSAAERCHELQIHDDAATFWKAAVGLASDQYEREDVLDQMVDSLRDIDYDAFPSAMAALLWALSEREQFIDRAELLWQTSAPVRGYLVAVREALTAFRGTLTTPLPTGDEFEGQIACWASFADACLFHKQFDLAFSALAQALSNDSDINKVMPSLIYRLGTHAQEAGIDLSWTLSDEIAQYFAEQAAKWYVNTSDGGNA